MTILKVVTILAMAAALAAGAIATAAPVFESAEPAVASIKAPAAPQDQAISASVPYYTAATNGEMIRGNAIGNDEVLANVTAVPEPMTLALFLAGIVGIGLARIRHKS
jgi:hypothetical protein